MADAIPTYLGEKKIMFLGDDGIGKTTLLSTYLNYLREFRKTEIFEGNFLAFNQFIFDVPLGRGKVSIRLLDLPAGTTEESRRDQYPKGVDMIVLCFAVDNPESFGNVTNLWLREVRQIYVNFNRIYLLGLGSERRANANGVLVSAELANRVHYQHRFYGSEYMECASDPESVSFFMDALINRLFTYNLLSHDRAFPGNV